MRLTALELRVFAYLMHHRDRVVPQAELVEHIYDRDDDRDSNTVEVFIARLRRKLGAGTIETVRGLGYRVGTAAHERAALAARRAADRRGAVDGRAVRRRRHRRHRHAVPLPALPAASSTACSSTCRSPARWRWCAWPAASPDPAGAGRAGAAARRVVAGARRRRRRVSAGAFPARGAAARRRPQRPARPPGRDGAAGAVAGRRSGPRPEDAAGGHRPRGRARRGRPGRVPSVLRQQVDRMRRQIDYHLAHARAAASGATARRVGAASPRRRAALVRTLDAAPCRSRSRPSGSSVGDGDRRARAARGPRRDARQPARQRLQVGPVDGAVSAADPRRPRARRWSTTTARACRRRCAGDVLRRGVRADEAAPGVGPRPGDRRRSRRAVRRRRLPSRRRRSAARAPASSFQERLMLRDLLARLADAGRRAGC